MFIDGWEVKQLYSLYKELVFKYFEESQTIYVKI